MAWILDEDQRKHLEVHCILALVHCCLHFSKMLKN